MIKRMLKASLSLMMAGAIVLTGCTSAGDDNLPPAGNGGRLNLAATEPYNLDPALVGDAGGLMFVTQIFSGLVKVTETGVEPDIATDWEISGDGRVYIFNLRTDVTFHDGTLVTAADFKYSWERALNPNTGSTTARTYLGDIVGAAEMLDGTTEELTGVRVIDDYTLEVTIDSARSYFLSKLTYATAFAVDTVNVAEGGEWWRDPNGTGPFMMDQWSTDSYIMLKKNENYYGGAPSLDSVVFKFLAGRAMDLYELGMIDVAGVDSAYIDRALDPSGIFAGDAQVISQLSLYFMGFNCAEAPFDDPLVRQAFSLALDRNSLIELVFNNMNEAAEWIVPPGIPGYDPEITGIGFNPELARELIAQSSYGSVDNLPEITLTTLGYGGLISPDLEAVIYQWRVNLGVDVKVRQLEPEVFLYNLKQEKDQIYYQGWIADYPHPQNFLEILFQTGADNNWGEYSNLLVDQLLAEAAAVTDQDISEALYRQVEEILVAEAAVWPYYFGRSYILVQPYVKGYELSPLGVPILQNVSIDRLVEAPTGLTVS